MTTLTEVNPSTGRRLYDADQFLRLNQFVAQKHLGFPLEQIRTLISDGIDAVELRGMLRMRAADLETRLLRDGQTLDRVPARLLLIEDETAMAITDVELKTVAPQRVLALHQLVGEEADADQLDVEARFERVMTLMDSTSADRASPISWRDDDEHTLRLHAGFLAPAAYVPGLDVVELPGISVASIVRRGAVADMNEAHQGIARWAETHDHLPRPLVKGTGHRSCCSRPDPVSVQSPPPTQNQRHLPPRQPGIGEGAAKSRPLVRRPYARLNRPGPGGDSRYWISTRGWSVRFLA